MKISRLMEQAASTYNRLDVSQRESAAKKNRIRLIERPRIPVERMTARTVRLTEADNRPSPRDLERILGKNDLLDMNYMARAMHAARSVCRIILRDDNGREIGYGSGFKVSPSLVITNHHVLRTAEEAGTAQAEFEFELDALGRPRPTTRFDLDPARFYLSSQTLDFALVAVAATPTVGNGKLSDYGFQRLIAETGKINIGESMTIIQHPGGQPKQIAIRANQLIDIKELVLLYSSDTSPGSSGSPVFNDSWQIVGLHHSGVPKTDDQGNWLLKTGLPAGPDADDSEIDWLANEGIRASRIVRHVEQSGDPRDLAGEFLSASRGEIEAPPLSPTVLDPEKKKDVDDLNISGAGVSGAAGYQVHLEHGGARVTLPLQFDVQMVGDSAKLLRDAQSMLTDSGGLAIEVTKEPIIDRDYSNRQGYDDNFMGTLLRMPRPRFSSRVAKMEDNSFRIPYQHFSVIVQKQRRLALITGANVDGRVQARRPDLNRPDSDYTRKGLGGFAQNDREKWALDPRILEQFQLPDRFYNKDRQSFDKGHLVRRDIVCFGDNYAEVQRANGDSYHVTNCSPQVLQFNRSNQQGIWGKLENHVMDHAESQKLCVFSGPIFKDDDPVFKGVDDDEDIVVKIPRNFWKVVVAINNGALQAYAFKLEQDLSGVRFEEFVPGIFKTHMISLQDLEDESGEVRFYTEMKSADQFGSVNANELFRREGFEEVLRA